MNVWAAHREREHCRRDIGDGNTFLLYGLEELKRTEGPRHDVPSTNDGDCNDTEGIDEMEHGREMAPDIETVNAHFPNCGQRMERHYSAAE